MSTSGTDAGLRQVLDDIDGYQLNANAYFDDSGFQSLVDADVDSWLRALRFHATRLGRDDIAKEVSDLAFDSGEAHRTIFAVRRLIVPVMRDVAAQLERVPAQPSPGHVGLTDEEIMQVVEAFVGLADDMWRQLRGFSHAELTEFLHRGVGLALDPGHEGESKRLRLVRAFRESEPVAQRRILERLLERFEPNGRYGPDPDSRARMRSRVRDMMMRLPTASVSLPDMATTDGVKAAWRTRGFLRGNEERLKLLIASIRRCTGTSAMYAGNSGFRSRHRIRQGNCSPEFGRPS